MRLPARGDPAGEARGGEAAGQGVGGERAAPPQRPPPPEPASTFLYSPGEARAPSPRGPAAVPRRGHAAEFGGRFPPAARSSWSKLSGAASPTAIFPGRRPRRPCLQLPPRLPNPIAARYSGHGPPCIPLPACGAPNCTGTPSRQQLLPPLRPFSGPRCPVAHPPTASAARCQLSSPPPYRPPWAPVREAPLPAAAAVPAPGSPLAPIYCHNPPNNKLLSRLASTRTPIGCS